MAEMAETWTQAMENPQTWRLLRDYLEFLGQDTIQQMGYSYSGLEATLYAYKPCSARRWFTFSLDFLLETPPQDRSIFMRSLMRLGGSVQRRGAKATALEIYGRTLDALSNSD
jgi:hypothetical protein